jgi:ubiquitin-protein ligase E3 C
LSSYFNVAPNPRADFNDFRPALPKTPETAIAGLSGISIDYVKGLVTGLLRMVHERDSRRKFLPTDHWLMTSLFDMSSFIPDVVAEEESRHQVQEEDDNEDVHMIDEEMEGDTQLIGTGRDRNIRYHEQLERQQRYLSRRRYLQTVAPRSEILQNMPFFIPFTTRVQIFREFVRRDQYKRRSGMPDAELWRIQMMNSFDPANNLSRHTATIRRKHEFEDAFEQFYELKDGLKEPIQITFMDQFGGQEAGIDGGGVTKEFLTSVTSQAFTPSDELDLFAENEHHLLYPNPAAVDEQKEILKNAGLSEGTQTFEDQIKDLLRRYEFLGRIIGKCLYEGILVDINFAGFFLLKWALTGGDGQAPRESAYRANLNDLRDLDEELYKGLIQLKNYPGDVEDFALNFTVSDTITTNYRTGATKTVTRDLRPDGANISVTNQNRLIYITFMARHRLSVQPHRQTDAFLRGLSSMISPSWLSMFNQTELQTLIGGTSSSIDVADLRRNTLYGGLYVRGDDPQDHQTIEIFWKVMESLSDKERRAVLKFVTSTPRAPLLGFGSLNPRFSIRDSGDDETRLPSASTCVNLMKLPRYKSEAVMRKKLLYAVMSGAGFDLS